ncbi:hypothetical protein RHMOL_Rhmol10G0189000 [Rhododendron molle]|uniref:Uncharacterized protein n=1 Tax=Rhododendron molle TaxID=49168 RepID=A0ACC0M406_RHOML|nr:hypothetical protein RHMOL_Rhmol10G0189000 [Rhododendron molle]
MAGGREGESTTYWSTLPHGLLCVSALSLSAFPSPSNGRFTTPASLTMNLDIDLLYSADPGPVDGSILVLQEQHRSKKVWDVDVS